MPLHNLVPDKDAPYVETTTIGDISTKTYEIDIQDVPAALIIPADTAKLTLFNWTKPLDLTASLNITQLYLKGSTSLDAAFGGDPVSTILPTKAKLTHLYLPETLTEVPANLCKGFTKLTHFSAPGAVKFGNYCLDGCTALQWVDGTSAEELGDYSLRGLTQLQQFVGTGLRVIRTYALDGTIKENTKIWIGEVERLEYRAIRSAILGENSCLVREDQETAWGKGSTSGKTITFQNLEQATQQSLNTTAKTYAYEFPSLQGFSPSYWANPTHYRIPALKVLGPSGTSTIYADHLPFHREVPTATILDNNGNQQTGVPQDPYRVPYHAIVKLGIHLENQFSPITINGTYDQDISFDADDINTFHQQVTLAMDITPTKQLTIGIGGPFPHNVQLQKAPNKIRVQNGISFTGQLKIENQAAISIEQVTGTPDNFNLCLTQQWIESHNITTGSNKSAFGVTWNSISVFTP